MPISIPNAAFIKLYFVNAQNLMINVIGARVTGNPTFNQGLADSIGSGIKSAWNSNIGATLSSVNCSLVRVGVRDMRTPNQPEFRDTGAAAAGVGAGDLLPPQTSFVVTLRTANTGKSNRGRVYLGGFSETQNNTLGAGLQAVATGAVAFVTAIDTTLQPLGLRLAVVSRPSDAYVIVKTTTHADNTTTTETLSRVTAKVGGATQVTLIESRNLAWETQRRRNNGRGALPTTLTSAASQALPE